MCGRFVSASPPDELARYFDVQQVAEEVLEPSYNVAPTNDVYVVLETGGVRRLEAFHWGLIPFWAKDMKVGNKMINARADTLPERNAYKRPFARRRCIIPADGFFEWKKLEGQKRKQPYYISRADAEPIAFAGLWELWKPKETEDDESTWVHSCVIITTDPNEKMAEIHDRMPVILPPSAWDTWLDRDNDDIATLGKLLIPAPAQLITMHPISTRVNRVGTNDPSLIEPATPEELVDGGDGGDGGD